MRTSNHRRVCDFAAVIEPVPVIELVEIPQPAQCQRQVGQCDRPPMPNTTTRVCPKCGNTTGIPIAYGLPDFELMESAQRGEVALGGCIVMDDNADWRCTDAACGQAW